MTLRLCSREDGNNESRIETAALKSKRHDNRK
jgi:hypothetical protein